MKVEVGEDHEIEGKRERFEDAMLLALKMEEGAESGKQVDSRSCKRQGMGSLPLEPPKKTQLC